MRPNRVSRCWNSGAADAQGLAADLWHDRGPARHCERVAEIAEKGGFQLTRDEMRRRREKAEKSVVREIPRLLRP